MNTGVAFRASYACSRFVFFCRIIIIAIILYRSAGRSSIWKRYPPRYRFTISEHYDVTFGGPYIITTPHWFVSRLLKCTVRRTVIIIIAFFFSIKKFVGRLISETSCAASFLRGILVRIKKHRWKTSVKSPRLISIPLFVHIDPQIFKRVFFFCLSTRKFPTVRRFFTVSL